MAKTNIIAIETIEVSNIQELQGLKKEQLKVVKENPYIEIIDKETFEVAKQRRTALLTQSTTIEKKGKDANKFLNNIKSKLSDEFENLANITRESYDKQQAEVKRYEDVLQKQAEEKQRKKEAAEQEIKDRIENHVEGMKGMISEMNDENKERLQSEITTIISQHKGTFNDFDLLFDAKSDEVLELMFEKIESIEQEKVQLEEQRKSGHEKFIDEVDRKVKNVILEMDEENFKNYKVSVVNILGTNRDFEEYKTKLESKKSELMSMFQKRENELQTLFQKSEATRKENEDFQEYLKTKRINERSEVLIEKGFYSDSNGDFKRGVHIVSKLQIETLENEKFINLIESFVFDDVNEEIEEFVPESENQSEKKETKTIVQLFVEDTESRYTAKDLVSFGNYLLSSEREEKIKFAPRHIVNDVDVEMFNLLIEKNGKQQIPVDIAQR